MNFKNLKEDAEFAEEEVVLSIEERLEKMEEFRETVRDVMRKDRIKFGLIGAGAGFVVGFALKAVLSSVNDEEEYEVIEVDDVVVE